MDIEFIQIQLLNYKDFSVFNSPDINIAEGEDPLLRPADVLEQAVGGDAEHPLRPDIVDAGLPEADEGPDAAQEQVPLGELQDALHDPLVHQRKIAGIVGDGEIGEGVEHPVEELVGHPHEQGRFPLDPAAVDHVVPFAPLGHELFDQLGRILEVAVQQHAGVLGRDLHAAAEGRLGAEVARMGDADDPFVAAGDGADDLLAVVRAVVVDEDDLVIDLELGKGILQALVHDRDGLVVLVAGDDGRYAVGGVEAELFRGKMVFLRVGEGAVPGDHPAEPLAQRGPRPPAEAFGQLSRGWRTSR